MDAHSLPVSIMCFLVCVFLTIAILVIKVHNEDCNAQLMYLLESCDGSTANVFAFTVPCLHEAFSMLI